MDSVFDSISLRELYGNRLHSQACGKLELITQLTRMQPKLYPHSPSSISNAEVHKHSVFILPLILTLHLLRGTTHQVKVLLAISYFIALPDLILLAQEDGLVHLYNTSVSGPQAFIRDYEPHANAVFDVRWLASGASFLTASGDQSIRLVDAERGISLQQFFGHTMSVRCLSLMPSDTRKYPT
ncbi:putative prokaryotic DNA topoisomerase [Fasciolopsis buskii]|uniref:Putative prokaryotic DNA topoisomerase n=1 Tax=Fasciolopsis buskii TaxID=27845 RepID=A0A8E0VEC3_9TREM|nr:putative prokaryotic DNA topoisomerase [Fasciolopsis buski]